MKGEKVRKGKIRKERRRKKVVELGRRMDIIEK